MDSLPPVLRRYWPLALAALLFGLYGWALVVATASGHDGAIGPRFNAIGADWVIFLAAGRAIFSHDLAHIYDQSWITHAVNSQFGHWLSAPEPFPLFPYPPVYLLLIAPFALLPVAWSIIASQALSFAALAWALRRLAPDRSYSFFLVGAVLCPAASNNVLAGTNAVLVAALIVGGIALLERRALLGGLLLGLVIFKPQYFPLLPLALGAAGQKRALAGVIAGAALFVLLSAVLFGPQLWLDWIGVYLHPQTVAGVNATQWGHRWDDSVSTGLTLLGAPPWLANNAQVLAALVAGIAVWLAFRARHPRRLAILLCATVVASPHVSNYDLILPAIAALAWVAELPAGSRPLALLLPLAVWTAALFNPPRVMPLGLLTPWLIFGLIWVLLREKPDQNPLPARG
jgi:hypothetical protein